MKLQTMKCIFVSLSLVAIVAARDVLTEKPDFLNPCSVSDPSFDRCFSKNVEGILSEWKNGVPGLKSLSPIDPLYVKRVSINQNPNSPISINLNLNDVLLSGVSGAVAKGSSFNKKAFAVKVQLLLPKLIINGDYDISGRILALPLGGNGKASLTVDKAVANFGIRFKRREEDGFTFTEVDKLRVDLQEVAGVRVHLDNLFGGDTAADDSTNAILSAYEQGIFAILRPSLNEALTKVMKDRWTKIFAYVPATYFFEDLPTAD